MQRELRMTGDGGAAAVEFALLLPFLALLVSGTIDLGRWYSAWNETKNAAREGAAYGQTHPNNQRPGTGVCAAPNNIEDRARQELSGNSSDATFIVAVSPAAVTCDDGTVDPGDTIVVTVQRKVKLITPLIRNIVGDVAITADVEAKVLG